MQILQDHLILQFKCSDVSWFDQSLNHVQYTAMPRTEEFLPIVSAGQSINKSIDQSINQPGVNVNIFFLQQSQWVRVMLPYLLWVMNTLLAWPSPLQPGSGQWGSSCLDTFQGKTEPFMEHSFCLFAAMGQLPALR